MILQLIVKVYFDYAIIRVRSIQINYMYTNIKLNTYVCLTYLHSNKQRK